MAVDVVVVNYHTDELCNGFVDSYNEHRFDGCTLTVVDVAAPADWDNCASTEPFTRHLGVSWNCGFGVACNRGAEGGTNDVILLANADTVLTEGLRTCYDALVSREDWGVLGPRQVDNNGDIVAGGIFGPDQAPLQRGWKARDFGDYSDIREDACFIAGSLHFIKRKVWQELTECKLFQDIQPGSKGAFLETPHYYEDTWCGYHARAHGYRCVFYGPVRMTHYWHVASPHGGWADQQMFHSKQIFREACGHHGIVCEA